MKMKKITALATALALSLLMFTACNPTPSTSENSRNNGLSSPEDAYIQLSEYPRVDGSTANLPYMALVLSRTTGIPLEEAEKLVGVTTTQQAWDNLVNNNADILIVYEASEETIARLQGEYDNLEIIPIGIDGLVFVVNTENPIDNLTQEELVSIYTGEVTNWSEVGGSDVDIMPFQRVAGSGSQTMFLKLLMKGIDPMDAPTELVLAGMGGLIEEVASFDGSASAIGYSVYYYVTEMNQNPYLKILAVDGIDPTPETLGDGTYPLTNEYYVVIRADEPEGSPARMLRDWIISPEGVEALLDSGYVPVPIIAG